MRSREVMPAVGESHERETSFGSELFLGEDGLFGMPPHVFLRRLPSLLRGSLLQSVATLRPPEQYAHTGRPALMLVPGLFCTPSVFNRLGRELDRLGFDVYLPRSFAFFHGVLANTDRLVRSVAALLADLAALKAEGLSRVTLVGHSLGGLIALGALSAAQQQRGGLPDISRPILLASPVGGAPIARPLASLVPACRDLAPGSLALGRLRALLPQVGRILLSDEDSLAPEASQVMSQAQIVRMPGYQHMDFYVGTPAQVEYAAHVIAEAVLDGRQPEVRRSESRRAKKARAV